MSSSLKNTSGQTATPATSSNSATTNAVAQQIGSALSAVQQLGGFGQNPMDLLGREF